MPRLRSRASQPCTRAGSSIGLALALAAGTARSAELRLDEPAACVTVEELSFRAERALGQPLGQAGPLELRVTATQDRKRGYRAGLEISQSGVAGSSTRTFQASSCEELLDTLALALAVALGSHLESAPVPAELAPESAASVPSPPVTAAPVPAPDGPAATEASNAGPHFATRGWLVADSGTLPRAGLGAALGASLVWPGVEMRALGTLLPQRESGLDATNPGSPGVEMALLAGSLSGCALLGAVSGSIAVGVCAGWEIGQLSGRGTNVDVAHQNSALWSAARVDFGADWTIPETALALELVVTAAAPLTRDEFILKDIGSVHRPANVVGRAALGVRWDIR